MKTNLKRTMSMLLVFLMLCALMTGCKKKVITEISVPGETIYESDSETDVGSETSDTSSTSTPNGTTSKKQGTSTNTTTTTPPTPGGTVDAPQAGSNAESGDLWSKIGKKYSGKTIKLLQWWDEGEVEKNKNKIFTEKTGVKVKPQVVGISDYYSKLASLILSGQSPDVAGLASEYFPQYYTKKLFRPITDGNFDLSDPVYDLEIMKNFKWQGKDYGVAVKGSTHNNFILIYWNKTMFKNKGITQTPEVLWKNGNWNWDTMLDLAAKFPNNDSSVYGLGTLLRWYWVAALDTDHVIINETGIINNTSDPKVFQGWKIGNDVQNETKVCYPTTCHIEDFGAGKLAMFADEGFQMQSGSAILGKNGSMKDEWGVVPFPNPKGFANYVAPMATCLWGLPAKSKNPELASYFIRYWLDESYTPNSEPTYTKQECYDILNWLGEQKKRVWLSNGVLNFGGEYHFYDFQADMHYAGSDGLKSKLDSWSAVFQGRIDAIMKEFNEY